MRKFFLPEFGEKPGTQCRGAALIVHVMSNRRTKKLTYAIKEVSQITGLKAYVLRFWETEFEELRPAKSSAGSREYTLEDIKLVFLIKRLLYEEKYTIEGARQRMLAMKKNGQQMDLSFERLRREDALFEIKKELQEMLALLGRAPKKSKARQRAPAALKKKPAPRSARSSPRPAPTPAHTQPEIPLFPEESVSP